MYSFQFSFINVTVVYTIRNNTCFNSMENLIEVLAGLVAVAALGAIVREAQQATEEVPVLIPIPVKDRREQR